MVEINNYVLLSIIVISITLLLITILIISTIKYNIKQKYYSINQYLLCNVSYEDKQKLYKKKLKEAGITSRKEKKLLLKILEALPL